MSQPGYASIFKVIVVDNKSYEGRGRGGAGFVSDTITHCSNTLVLKSGYKRAARLGIISEIVKPRIF